MIRLQILCLLFALTACAGNVPKDITEAVAYFETTWSTKTKEEFKNKPENEAVTDAHFGAGMWIRNEWIRGKRDTLLRNQFNALGIYHPDDMSSIILTSLHRKLNHKPVDIKGQVKRYQDYWNPIQECEIKAKMDALNNYKRFTINDSIEIHMYVDGDATYRNAVTFDCPLTEDWKFDPEKDLLIRGIVVGKYFINSETNVFF